MTGGSELMKTDGKTRGRSRGQDVRQPFAGLNAWIEAWSSGFLAGIGMAGTVHFENSQDLHICHFYGLRRGKALRIHHYFRRFSSNFAPIFITRIFLSKFPRIF